MVTNDGECCCERSEIIDSFGAIAEVPSNTRAIEASVCFGAGEIDSLALIGPSGWGKTRMLEAASRALRLSGRSRKPVILDAAQWQGYGAQLEPQEALLLDNLQDGLRCSRRRIQLMLALERRVKAKKPTMVVLTCCHKREVERAILPRSNAWSVIPVAAPTTVEKKHIVRHMAHVHGLQVSDTIVAVLGSKLSGNGRSLEGALKRLRLAGTAWMSDVAALRACGLLAPYIEDTGRWDFASFVTESVCRLEIGLPCDLMSVHLLRNVAQLQEADVSTALELDPRSVHISAQTAKMLIRQDPKLRKDANLCVAYIVDRLALS